MIHLTNPTQQGFRPHTTSECSRCADISAYTGMLASLQRQIDAKRAELARLSHGSELVAGGYVRLAAVGFLREMSPHVMTYDALQLYLWGDISEANLKNLKVQMSNIRRLRYGLSEDERIECLPRVGYRMVRR